MRWLWLQEIKNNWANIWQEKEVQSDLKDLIASSYRWQDWSPEGLNDLADVTESKLRLRIQISHFSAP